MRFFLFLFSLLFFFSCKNGTGTSEKTGQETAQNTVSVSQEEDLITCWGIGLVELGDDLAAITERVGKGNLRQDSLFLGGSFESVVTSVYKDSPKEIVIHWRKTSPFKKIDFLEVSHPGSPYMFANGIKIGTSLTEIQKLNGNKPIRLWGFGWDYGGSIIDLGNGTLQGDVPCFSGQFALDKEVVQNIPRAILGETALSSDHPLFKKYQARLARIRIENKD